MGSVRSKEEKLSHPVGQRAQEIVFQEVLRLDKSQAGKREGKASLSPENEYTDPNRDVPGSRK